MWQRLTYFAHLQKLSFSRPNFYLGSCELLKYVGLIGSGLLTFIGYKHTHRQAKYLTKMYLGKLKYVVNHGKEKTIILANLIFTLCETES